MRDFGVGEKKLPGRHHLTGCSKTTPGEWAILTSHSWSLYLLLLFRGFHDRRALSKTFGLPVSKTESYLSLIWVNDVFTRLHHRRMVHHGTSISARAKREIEFPDSPSVSCSLSVTPLYESPCQSLWSQTTLFYCMDMSLFSILTGGEDFQGLRWKKKDNTFERKSFSGILSKQKRSNTRVYLYIHKVRIWGPECGFAWPLISNTLLAFSYWRPAFIKINSPLCAGSCGEA